MPVGRDEDNDKDAKCADKRRRQSTESRKLRNPDPPPGELLPAISCIDKIHFQIRMTVIYQHGPGPQPPLPKNQKLAPLTCRCEPRYFGSVAVGIRGCQSTDIHC
jgi:hypothetical protein